MEAEGRYPPVSFGAEGSGGYRALRPPYGINRRRVGDQR
jgi:hypothetical protein